MKKILFVLVMVLCCEIFVSCNSKSVQLEKKIKTELKKDAKLSGLSVKFNNLEVIESDTIPTEVNGLYLEWMGKAIANFKLADESSNTARSFIGLDHNLFDEYLQKSETYLNTGMYYDSLALIEYKNNHKPCYIVHADYILKGGATPIRVDVIQMYKWHDFMNDFECCYTSTENPQKRFEKYKN